MDIPAQMMKSAVLEGRCAVIRSLLAGGVDINRPDAKDGTTALHWASVSSDHTGAVAALLLDAGADPDRRDANDRTPLQWFSFHRPAAAQVSALRGFSGAAGQRGITLVDTLCSLSLAIIIGLTGVAATRLVNQEVRRAGIESIASDLGSNATGNATIPTSLLAVGKTNNAWGYPIEIASDGLRQTLPVGACPAATQLLSLSYRKLFVNGKAASADDSTRLWTSCNNLAGVAVVEAREPK